MFSYTILVIGKDKDGEEFEFVKEFKHHCPFKAGDWLKIPRDNSEFLIEKVIWDIDHLQHAYIELETFSFTGALREWVGEGAFDSADSIG